MTKLVEDQVVEKADSKEILAKTAGRRRTEAGEFDDCAIEAQSHLDEIKDDLSLDGFLAWFAAWYPYVGYRNIGPIIRDFSAERGHRKNKQVPPVKKVEEK